MNDADRSGRGRFDRLRVRPTLQVETVMRMIKARQGESLTASSDDARDAELGLLVLAHNLMVVLRLIREDFYRAGHSAIL